MTLVHNIFPNLLLACDLWRLIDNSFMTYSRFMIICEASPFMTNWWYWPKIDLGDLINYSIWVYFVHYLKTAINGLKELKKTQQQKITVVWMSHQNFTGKERHTTGKQRCINIFRKSVHHFRKLPITLDLQKILKIAKSV